MSAINGIVSLNKIDIEEEELIIKGLETYTFNKRDQIKTKNIFFEAGLQCITEESLNEILPYQKNEWIITADAILDNRGELIEQLEVKESGVSDSELILASYIKWREKCVDFLLGDFAFAIWNKQTNELFCARDHVGKRTLYYMATTDKFYFSTILKPLILIKGKDLELNERWIIDFLVIPGATSSIDITGTVYKDIFQLPPAHYLIFKKEGIKVQKYWYPEKIKPLRLDSDQAYEQAFRKVFDEAVRCRLRTNGKVGIMLSSGLDSTAIAAIAAKELEKEGKELESFTEIPMDDFINNRPKNQIVNEREYVIQMAEVYKNIKTHFNSYKSEDAYIHIDNDLKELEQPYKVVQNFYWLKGLFKEASESSCKVLLDGQFGNGSISQGNVDNYWYTLFRQFKWLTLKKEVRAYGKVKHIQRRKLYPLVAKEIIGALNVNLTFNAEREEKKYDGMANRRLVYKWHAIDRINRVGFWHKNGELITQKKWNKLITNLILFSHLGALEVESELVSGIIRRDPTRDKRVIEYCISIPSDQYVNRGRERWLIRRSMKDEVPDSIRLNYTTRGRQAADWVQRLVPYSEDIRKELSSIVDDHNESDYLNLDKIKGYIKIMQKDINKLKQAEWKEIMIIIVFSRFIKCYQMMIQ